MRYWLVMPAAGQGQRFGGTQPKQFERLGELTVMETALGVFLGDERCVGIAVATAPGAELRLNAATRSRVRIAAGGAQRCQSVLAGLEALAAEAGADEWVLVHDAARPCLSRADLDQLLAAGGTEPDGALLAEPVGDTVKQADPDERCVGTVPRARLWRAQTPQMFRFGRLRASLHAALAAGRMPTDESEAIEWAGGRPRLVAATASNLKITRREDLLIAAAILAARQCAPRSGS
ncbi:MAG TPA: 2-C-methyl-D-erythritol 4-phosphate cytidylyltransferase [Steroidobacteraceae bacterium]